MGSLKNEDGLFLRNKSNFLRDYGQDVDCPEMGSGFYSIFFEEKLNAKYPERPIEKEELLDAVEYERKKLYNKVRAEKKRAIKTQQSEERHKMSKFTMTLMEVCKKEYGNDISLVNLQDFGIYADILEKEERRSIKMSFLGNMDDVKVPGEIADGDYTVVSEEVEVKDTKAGNGKYLKIRFLVEETGDKIWHMFNFENANPKAEQIGKGQLKQFYTFGGLTIQPKEPLELCGLRCGVKIKNKTDDYSGSIKPTIVGFKKLV